MGARYGEILRMVLCETMILVIVATVAGLGSAWALVITSVCSAAIVLIAS